MKKRILAILLCTVMALSTMGVLCGYAIGADYITGEMPTNYYTNGNDLNGIYKIGEGTNLVTFDCTRNWASFDIQASKDINAENRAAINLTSVPGLSPSQRISEKVSGGTAYVVSCAAKRVIDSNYPDAVPQIGVSVNNGAGATSFETIEYGTEGFRIESEEWTVFKATMLIPGNPDYTEYRPTFIIGLADGTPEGAKVEINITRSTVQPYYVSKEEAFDISLNAVGATAIGAGEELSFKATLLNQLGLKGALAQNINWYVTDVERSEIKDGFTFLTNENITTMAIAETVTPGEYTVIAENAENAEMCKGINITVQKPVINDFIPTASGESGVPYNITLSCEEEKENYTVLDSLTLKAEIIDGENNSEGLTQSFVWTSMLENRRDETNKITITPLSDGNAQISFSKDLESGTYFVIATSAAEESKQMRRGYKIVIDNEEINKNISNDFKNLDAQELLVKIDGYVDFIAGGAELYSKTDKTDLCRIIAESGVVFTTDNLAQEFKKACIISLHNVNNGNVALLDENCNFVFLNEIGFDESDKNTIFKIYNDFLSSDSKKTVADSLTGKNVSCAEDILKLFREKVILEAIKNPVQNGTGYVQDILTEDNLLAADIDGGEYLNSSKKSKYEKDIAGKDLTKAELEEILKADYSDNESSSGSSSGGGKRKPTVDKAAVIIPPQPQNEQYFVDIGEGHWAFSEIQFLQKLDIISGNDKKEFNPNAPVKREELVKMLVNAFDIKNIGSAQRFSDVLSGAWYEAFVNAAASSGVVNGLGDGTFGIGSNVTRQDMCVMIVRALNAESGDQTEIGFSDADSISEYAKNAVAYLSLLSMVNGFEDNTFRPLEPCTRAQAAKIIAGIINYEVEEVSGL